MKGNGLKLRRVHILGLSIFVLAGAAVLVSTSDSIAQWTPEEEEQHRLLGYHGVQITGQGEFLVASEESISAVAGEKYIDRNGLSVIPLRILGMAGRGYVEGVGESVYWLDKSRPVEGSMVRGKARGSDFPAVHEMRFHLFLTTEALPGRTFRSINPAVMVNNNSMSFPPRLGSRYVLKNVVELEDVNDPGVVVVRIVSNRNQIVGSGRSGAGLGRRPSES
jgi:hypothetical protein